MSDTGSAMWGHLWQVCDVHKRKTCFICHPEDANRFGNKTLRNYIRALKDGSEDDRAEIRVMQAVINKRAGIDRCWAANCPCDGRNHE